MKIAIAGSRGIPNNYGGFEQCAENLAVLLVQLGHQVTVYNPDYHAFDKPIFNGVDIVKIWNPEKSIGALGNFIYDYKCMKHAINNQFDILLVLGYTTSSIFFPFINKKKSVLITNMDGIEWKRDKWNTAIKKLAKWFESLGAKYSDYLVSDNREIRNYLLQEYQKDSVYIAYGAELFSDPNEKILSEYKLVAHQYDMLIARLEKENNIETILDGIVLSKSSTPFLVIGNHTTPYGEFLKYKYKDSSNIQFVGGIYNFNHLNNLRWYCRLYFHGHSVGGTNPSLLEAMASKAFIAAHDNNFNRDVLNQTAMYFSSPEQVSDLILNIASLSENRISYIENNYKKIESEFNWMKITKEYEALFNSARMWCIGT